MPHMDEFDESRDAAGGFYEYPDPRVDDIEDILGGLPKHKFILIGEARYFSWLPWPRKAFVYKKETTLPDALAMTYMLGEMTGYEVALLEDMES
ncbi:MAG: hypothetical protein K0S82_1784 [Gaiellaceae bacterium]|nr:hypothetical protein [Gaiellaceae bacterium]